VSRIAQAAKTFALLAAFSGAYDLATGAAWYYPVGAAAAAVILGATSRWIDCAERPTPTEPGTTTGTSTNDTETEEAAQ